MKGLSPSPLYYNSVLPSLLHSGSTGSPKRGDLPSPMGLSKVENICIRAHVGLSSSLGKNAPSLWSLLCLVHRSHKNGIPTYLPENATSSRRASLQGERGEQRYFWSVGWQAGLALATADITVCVLFWPLNIIVFGQVLKAARFFNQISYFFPKFPWKGFTRLLLISKGGLNSSLQSAILLALTGAICMLYCQQQALRVMNRSPNITKPPKHF